MVSKVNDLFNLFVGRWIFAKTPMLGFLLILISTSVIADQQQWPLPDEVSASLMHEIPVLHTAFVQIGEELHYVGKENMNKNKNNPHHQQQNEMTKNQLQLEIDPPMLDFGDNSVGSAQKRKVYVKNLRKEVLHMDAFIVNSVEFQASYYESNKIGPGESTWFEVVFLPREIGKRTTTIEFYSAGDLYKYKVTGNCVSNPYRISPFVGYHIPLNTTISKPLILHNPYPFTMTITEISSSGGNGHIELPHGIDENYAEELPQYWDIRPFQTKQIANVMLVGGMTDNTTCFVRISAELQAVVNVRLDDIILTIPIEVTKSRGVYSTSEILDFGLLRSGERSNSQIFSVFQYQLGGRLEFETLYVEKGDHTGIYMEFSSNPPIIVYPGRNAIAGPKADLVKVYFDASRIDFPDSAPAIKHHTGSIIAVSRGGNYNLTIPFKADVFQGNLYSVGNDLSLQEDLRPPHQRIVRIENQLPFDVAIWNISMSSDAVNHFSVRLVDNVVSIRAGHIAPVFILKYNKKVPTSFDNAMIYVHTNTSTFRLYLNKFSGRMSIELTSVDKQSFDFGFVERNDTRTIRFVVWNHNRAEMRLKNLQVPSRQAYRLYEVGTQKRGSLFSDVSNDERIEYVQAIDVDIQPQSGKIFDLELKVPQDGLVRNGNILFETEYESKLFAVTYQVSTGSLQSIPEKITFGTTFPAKLVYRSLQVFNSFDEDMTVTRLTTLNQDPRFHFEGFDPNMPPVLRSGRLTNLGRVMMSPQIPCSHEYCYLGFPLNTNDGQWFVHGLTLPANLAEIDAYLYKKQRAKYDNLVKSGRHLVNTTVILDTDKAKNIKVKTSAELVWPRLLTRNSIHFPLTALGNFTIVNLTLANPTSMPIAIQVIPLVIYPDAEVLVDLFRPHLLTPLSEHVEMNETLMFSLRDTELFTLKPDSPVPKLREELESLIPHNVPRFTLSMILKPHMKVRLRLGFLPSDYTLRSSLLLIRNNLTVMEPVVMYGKGARIGVRLENMEARSKQALLFEIRHDHLTDCNNPKRLMHKLHSTLTVRRPFMVHNSGEVQFTITNMSINGVPCENRGFRILNCYPFKLQPNETYALDVAYTPDFLTTTNEADLQLYMHMNGSAWLFPLAATVPGDMLAKCHQALPRPPFENIMYYCCVTALIFCLVCVIACAYLEGDRAIACAIRQQFTTPRHVFDLNNLAKQHQQQQNQPKEAEIPQKEAPKTEEKWKLSNPSTLRVSSDAWIVKRYAIKLANYVVQLVHSVWKLSLFYRKDDKPAPQKNTKAKKKKNPVTAKKEEVAVVKPVSAAPQKVSQPKKSPKPTNNNNKRKKSSEKKEIPIQNRSKSREKKKGSAKKLEVLAIPEPEKIIEEPEIVEEVEEEDQEDIVEEIPEEMYKLPTFDSQIYQQFIDATNASMSDEMWDTPAAQAAMQYMNIWNYGAPLTVEQMQALIGHVGGGAEPSTPTQNTVNQFGWNYPQGGEEEKLLEEDQESIAPDWADEEVNASDAEMDFSKMAAASNNLVLTDDELEETNQNSVKKNDRNRKKNRSPSVASLIASSTLSKRLDSPQKMGTRRLTIGSEKKDLKSFARTPGAKPVSDPFQSTTTNPTQNYPTWSTMDFSLYQNESTSNVWGNSSSNSQQQNLDHQNQNLCGSPIDPLSGLGMDLGTTSYNTMFSGPDFNLWSDSKFDPTTAWANLVKKEEEEEDDEQHKK
ncbi:unnamed protein product [Caenorhabditis angaria]|uniref:Transmembrane protein n=1 Tax=Caenorhabditis angaria TaxID=860376 RepID=A0A9P1IJ17_9PELO|nr:unnamed protein product [Caenorhabditis angaria]